MKSIFFFTLLLALSIPGRAANPTLTTFIGETLEYRITWLGVPAGEARLAVDQIPYEGKPVIRIRGEFRTTSFFSLFYKVNDIITSLVDPETLRPLKLSVDFREGEDYSRKTETVFDYLQGTMRSQGGRNREVKMPLEFLELFTMFYLIRVADMSSGEPLVRTVVDGRRFYQVEAHLSGITSIRSVLGVHDCLEIKPTHVRLESVGINDGVQDVSIFLTQDIPRVPVLARGKLRIGSLVGTLVSIQG